MLRDAEPLQVDGGQDRSDDRVESASPDRTVHDLLLRRSSDEERRVRLLSLLRQSLEATLAGTGRGSQRVGKFVH